MQDAAVDSAPPIDEGIDAAVAPPNDLPDGAIDVSAGGDFTADLTFAHDDADKPGTTSTRGRTRQTRSPRTPAFVSRRGT